MIRQLTDIAPVYAIAPAALAADNTPPAVDLRGYDSAEVQIAVGVGGITFDTTHKVEFKVTHSNDDVSYDAVAAGDVQLGANCDTTVGTGGIVRSLIAAHAAATIARLQYVGGRRYLKVLADFSGTHGVATPAAVLVQRGRSHRTA